MTNRLIITIICFVLALVLGVVLLWPKYQSLQNLQKQVLEKKIELQTKTAYFSKIEETLQEFAKYQEQLAKISSALPPALFLPPLFDFLETAASHNGLILEKTSFQSAVTPQKSEEGGSKIQESHLNLTLAGSYSSLKNFLLTIEKSARLLEVENISFSAPQESEKQFSLELAMKIYSY